LRLRISVGLIATLALIVPSGAHGADFVAKLDAPGHHPKAGERWPIKVTAKASGRPVKATAFYRFLYQGQVVSTQYPSPHAPPADSPYHFKGSYRDPIRWPKRAIGYPLTFQVVVHSKGRGTVKLNYKVRVRD
jgi:hypothetical protein